MYQHENSNFIHWAHLDDINEVATITTKSASQDIAITSPLQTADNEMLNMALQMSMDAGNNVNADDIDPNIQRVLQQSAATVDGKDDDELQKALALSMEKNENQNPTVPQIEVIPDPPSQAEAKENNVEYKLCD